MSDILHDAPEPEKPPFVRAWPDRAFALVFYGLGYAYLRLAWRGGLCLSVFTALYAAAMLGYLSCKGRRPPRWSWFWLAALLGVGLGRGLFPNRSLLGTDIAVLHLLALYWPLCAAGAALRPCTSPLLPMDAVNAGLILPFGNLTAQARCLLGGWRGAGGKKRVLAALTGVGALVLLLAAVVPLLAAADEAFDRALASLADWFTLDWNANLWELVLAVPVGAYLFGLSYGAVNRRHTGHIREDRLAELGEDVRVAPDLTLGILLGGVCAVYVLFVAVQAQSLFSAFLGRLSGTDVYSEYAREGFFQLCRVASINGLLLLAANLLAERERTKNRLLRGFNAALSVLTLLILACAARKMLLYIQVCGLTPKRVLTMAFMAMLAVLFGGAVVWQWKKFNLIRLAVCFAAALFLVLCLCDLDGLLLAYNDARGIASTFFP